MMWRFVLSVLAAYHLLVVMKSPAECAAIKKLGHKPYPLFLMSFDGFRYDYVKNYTLPNFNWLKQNGAYTEFMLNAFSTLTFPSHWCIATGCYQEHHGVVNNVMYNVTTGQKFARMKDINLEWFGYNETIRPIWHVNQKAGNGRRSAVSWVGGEVFFDDVTHPVVKYDHTRSFHQLADFFLSRFNSTDDDEVINFGAMYYDQPDFDGHRFGPTSKEVEKRLYEVDKNVGYVLDVLKSSDLLDKLNLIILSDHGMASVVANDPKIVISKHIENSTEYFACAGAKTLVNIFVNKTNRSEERMVEIHNNLNKITNLKIYRNNGSIPERFHYANNPRIGDFFVSPQEGYLVFCDDKSAGEVLQENRKGDHGYDNELTSMHPIFFAHGPDFKKGAQVPTFRNIDVFPLICHLLGITHTSAIDGTMENNKDLLVDDEL